MRGNPTYCLQREEALKATIGNVFVVTGHSVNNWLWNSILVELWPGLQLDSDRQICLNFLLVSMLHCADFPPPSSTKATWNSNSKANPSRLIIDNKHSGGGVQPNSPGVPFWSSRKFLFPITCVFIVHSSSVKTKTGSLMPSLPLWREPDAWAAFPPICLNLYQGERRVISAKAFVPYMLGRNWLPNLQLLPSWHRNEFWAKSAGLSALAQDKIWSDLKDVA